MTDPGRQIFLSYSREDVAFARELRDWLLEQGHQPWMDLFDIPAGARWPTEIDRALKSSAAVIGLLSPAAVQSDNVLNEWDWAIANRRSLRLLLIEPCEIPFHYVSRNYIDFTGSREDGYAALIAALRQRRQPGEDAASDVTASSNQPAPLSHLAQGSGAGTIAASGSRLRRALSRRRETAQLVGRGQEQAELRRQLERASLGEGGLLLLGGEAGIGKTTLVEWLRGEATAQKALALTGGCYDLTTTPPYGPWVEILRAYQPEDGLPSIPEAMRDEAGLSSIPSQAALFEIVGEFLAEVSEQRPMLLILEDLHWADPASLEFLRFFSRFLGGLPILIVATYRDDELTRRHPLFELMPLLIRESGAHRLLLERLDERGIHDLITKRYPLPPRDTERLADYLQQLASGNPFFAGELLASLAEQGVLAREGDDWRLGSLDAIRVPRLVREVIESRLARLGEDVREALEIAAVIGQTVPLDLWTSISALPESRMVQALEQSLTVHVLEASDAPNEVAFSHALMRETLYEGVVMLRRRDLHRRVGDALVELPQPEPDAIAHHYREAGDRRAVEWLLRAAERAERRYSFVMAAGRYVAAYEMIQDDETRLPDQGWLLFHAGRLLNLGSRRQALSYLDRVREIAEQIGDPLLAASSLFVTGLCHNIDGEFARGIEEQRQALEMVEDIARGDQLAVEILEASRQQISTYFGGFPLWDRLDLDLSQGWSHAAMWAFEAGRIEQAEDLRARVTGSRGSPFQVITETAQALRHLVRGEPADAQRLFDEGREALSGAHAQAATQMVNQLVGLNLPYETEDVPTRRTLTESIAERQRQGAGAYGDLRPPITYTHFPLFYEGEWNAAARIALDGLHPNASGNFYPLARTTLAQIARHRGDTAKAWEHVHGFFPDPASTRPGNSNYVFSLHLIRTAVEIALDSEDLDTARAWLEAYGAWLDWAGAVLGRAEEQLFWARYHRLAGDPGKARQHAGRALERAIEPRQPLALIAVHRFLGSLDTGEKHYTDAESHLEQSRQLAEACALPFERALTLLEVARLRVATENRDEARSLLTRVSEICEPLEARPVLEQVAALEGNV